MWFLNHPLKACEMKRNLLSQHSRAARSAAVCQSPGPRRLLAKESAEKGFGSSATACHQATCASVSKQMTGEACALWLLVILANAVSPRGPPVAHSVVSSFCIFRHGWFCSSATAHHCICLCQCEQADNGSHLCSMATCAAAPWRPTARPSLCSQHCA